MKIKPGMRLISKITGLVAPHEPDAYVVFHNTLNLIKNKDYNVAAVDYVKVPTWIFINNMWYTLDKFHNPMIHTKLGKILYK